MNTNRPATLALRGLFGLFVAFVVLVSVAPPAFSQEDDGLAITGTARDGNREPVEGIGFTVTQDGSTANGIVGGVTSTVFLNLLLGDSTFRGKWEDFFDIQPIDHPIDNDPNTADTLLVNSVDG